MTWLWVAFGVGYLIAALFVWSLCNAAGDADERAGYKDAP